MTSTTGRRSPLRRWALAVVPPLVVVLTASACNAPGASIDDGAGPVQVGLLANLTGENATTFGIPFRRGFELALAEAAPVLERAGASLEVIEEDTRSDVAGAVTGFNQLARQGAPVVVHDSQSPQGQAIAPLTNDEQRAFLTGTGSALENEQGFAFRFTDLQTPTLAMGKYLLGQGATRVGVVTAQDNPSFATLAEASEASLPGGFASRQQVASNDTDFSAVLANLRQDGVDAVVLSVLPAQAGNILLQMQRAGGFENVLKAGTVALSEETYAIAGEAAGELVFPQVWAPGQASGAPFETAYRQRHGDTPTAYGALGYQVGWIVVAAVIEARGQGGATGPAIRDQLPAASTAPLLSEHGILDLTLATDGSVRSTGTIATFDPEGTIVAVEDGG